MWLVPLRGTSYQPSAFNSARTSRLLGMVCMYAHCGAWSTTQHHRPVHRRLLRGAGRPASTSAMLKSNASTSALSALLHPLVSIAGSAASSRRSWRWRPTPSPQMARMHRLAVTEPCRPRRPDRWQAHPGGSPRYPIAALHRAGARPPPAMAAWLQRYCRAFSGFSADYASGLVRRSGRTRRPRQSASPAPAPIHRTAHPP